MNKQRNNQFYRRGFYIMAALLALAVPLGSGLALAAMSKLTDGVNTSFHDTISAAYDTILSGSAPVISTQAGTFRDDIDFNQSWTVKLKGGYDANYQSIVGSTSIAGDLTISSGTVMIDNITLTAPSAELSLEVTTTTLPGGTVGHAYAAELAAIGGTRPYSWSLSSGSLPAGLSLTPSTGAISGTPTAEGSSSFTVQATDANLATATEELSITVSTATVSVTISPAAASVAPGGTQAFTAKVSGSTNTAVTWSVTESDGGTIDSSGHYTAPASTGTFHVIATSAADATAFGTATIKVTTNVTTSGWSPLKVGAGGWITGMDTCSTAAGPLYALRTDTYGGYVGNPNAGTPWQQVVNANAMPASGIGQPGTSEGVYEIRIAPSDCNRLYMTYRKMIFRSKDAGQTWSQTAFTYTGTMDPNDADRMWGEKMAVDPANPDVVYAGTPGSGLFVTTDGGTAWSAVAGIPVATVAAGITGIVFDSSSGTTAGRTKTIYAVSNGNGVYQTTNAGASWSALNGGPTTVTHAAIGTDGVYYTVNMTNFVYRYQNSAWATSADSTIQLHSIATDPFNPARIIGGRDSGHLIVSTDHGATWGAGVIWTVKRQATDVPWLANANEAYMSNGAMRFDPVVQNKLWFTDGIGVWYSTDPANTATTTWNSYSAGIEQLVARDVCVPPGSSNVVLAGLDRSVWVVPRANVSYPSNYNKMGSSASLIAAHSVTYSIANPNHLVAVVNHGLVGEPELSGYSLDGGATWTPFPTQPGTGGQSGDIVAPSIDNIIAVIGKKYAYRSTNRGVTWTPLSLPGDSGGDTQNLHCGYLCQKHILAVDGANPNTIYLYFYGHGIYRSTDSGASWTLVNSNAFDSANMFWQVKLRSVPGQAGHLFLTAGQSGAATDPNPANTFLWRSTDGGVTWTKFMNQDQSQYAANERIAEPYDVAAGKAAPGHTYPAIYFVGWYRASTSAAWQYGIWRSIDFDTNPANPTWSSIGTYPFGSIDTISVLAASQDNYGEVYTAFSGSGWGQGILK
jgi:hypothetical protein